MGVLGEWDVYHCEYDNQENGSEYHDEDILRALIELRYQSTHQ